MVKLCRSGDKDVRPNLISFNAVLNTLSKARTIQAAYRAEELLEQMEDLHKRSALYKSVRPNVISYTAVVSQHRTVDDGSCVVVAIKSLCWVM